MRKVVLFVHASLDGYVSGPNGEMDWIVYDEALQDYATEVHSAADAVIFGRVTYEMMVGFWPNLPEGLRDSKYHAEHARWLEKATKIVFSRTLDQVEWTNSMLIKDEIAAEIEKLKQQPGKDIIVIGSASLTHGLIRLGLIDEYRINVNPVVLGNGVPLFKDISHKVNLKLLQAIPFESGVVSLVYQSPQT